MKVGIAFPTFIGGEKGMIYRKRNNGKCIIEYFVDDFKELLKLAEIFQSSYYASFENGEVHKIYPEEVRAFIIVLGRDELQSFKADGEVNGTNE